MWACEEHPESEEHDEAALIILTKLDPPDYFSSHLKELRDMSFKYLSKELFSEEDWEGVRYWSLYVSQDDAHMNPFPCGLRKKTQNVSSDVHGGFPIDDPGFVDSCDQRFI